MELLKKKNYSLLEPSYFLQGIKENRSYIMGIAIICVIIYHAFCWVYNPIGKFNIGYFGVDIFLFLSGFGLCHSYEKNSLLIFYKNRLLRIYPLYFISVCIAYALYYNRWGVSTFLENLTTLGYYLHYGVNRFDWYLNALFTLYALFPLMYLYSKLKLLGVTLLTVIIFIFMHYHSNMPYWYDCLISRLPIFIYGILFSKCYKSCNYIIIVGLLLFFPCRIFSSRFLSTNFLVLPIILIALYLLPLINSKLKSFIIFCGKYSLELYLANEVIPRVYDVININVYINAILYIILEILFTYIFICITKSINRLKSHN